MVEDSMPAAHASGLTGPSGRVTYGLARQTIRRQMRRTFWRFQIFVTVSFLAFGIYLALNAPVNWWVAGPITFIIALAYFLLIYFHDRQQRRILYSLRIEVTPSFITRRQVFEDPFTINRANVTLIEERVDGLHIRTTDPRLRMFIPNGLAGVGDQEIRAILRKWGQFKPLPRAHNGPRRLLFWFSVIGSFLILLFVNNLWLMIALGIFLFAFGTYAEYRLSHREHVDVMVTRSYSLAYSFLIFVIVMKSCFLAFIALIS